MMEQKEKIVQISGSGEVLYALSSEGKMYVGTQHEKGFDWGRLPEIGFESVRNVPSLTSPGDEGSQPVLSAPADGEVATPAIKRDEVKPEAAKPAPTTQTK